MKRRFLPISLLLTIIILAQTSFVVNANGDSGKYAPRSGSEPTAQSFFKSIRANQETGLIDPAWLIQGKDVSQTRSEDLNWTSLGPDNYGTLTRGIVYDKNDASGNTVIIGTMGGGLFKSVNGGITWRSIGNHNLMVSTMVQAEDGTIYIGTGENRSAYNYNGLSTLNYEQSFVGNGIYRLVDEKIEAIESTSNWAFVNEIAVFGNKIYAATNEGLKISADNGATWTTLLEGVAYNVEVNPNGKVFSLVDNNIYMSEDENFVVITNGEENKLPATETFKIIAASPSDANFVYVAYLSATYGTGTIYMTIDGGENWVVAHEATPIYEIFGTRGLIDHAMTVYPTDPRKVLIGGSNLWVLRDIYGDGVFRLEQISLNVGPQIIGGIYNYSYIHQGIQNIVFKPGDNNNFYVGSEGGISKGSYNSTDGYVFEGANRYFIDAENHTSATRMFSVAFSGSEDMVLGGSLDHGSINVFGQDNTNNVSTGNAIFPNDISTTDAYATYGYFTNDMAAGPCAISTINKDIMFVTTTGAYAGGAGTPLFRTQSAGYDYDKDNFSYSVTDSEAYISNEDAFRTPIALFENFNDTKAVETTKFVARTQSYPAGSVVTFRSANGEYPIQYTLTSDLAKGDSIEIQDNISTTFLVATKSGLMMTRDALKFDKVADWWNVGAVAAIPNALTISADGNVAYVGTISGQLYKATGLADAVTAELFAGDSLTPSVVTYEEIDGTAFNGQAITSIAIDPSNVNNVVVTLGNYGNSNYVMYSTNGGQSFNPIQGNLPLAPVYSSLIEKETGVVFVGTENGLYYTENMSTWTKDGVVSNIPVMDIKQQLQSHEIETQYVYLIGEQNDTTDIIVYPGVENEGMIYVATYGRGLYRCDNYQVEGNEISVNEIETVEELEMSIYPNPVFDNAYITFNLEETANVSYQVYDLSGRLISNNVLGNYGQGEHQVQMNVDGFASGTYLIKVQAGAASKTSKILVY